MEPIWKNLPNDVKRRIMFVYHNYDTYFKLHQKYTNNALKLIKNPTRGSGFYLPRKLNKLKRKNHTEHAKKMARHRLKGHFEYTMNESGNTRNNYKYNSAMKMWTKLTKEQKNYIRRVLLNK